MLLLAELCVDNANKCLSLTLQAREDMRALYLSSSDQHGSDIRARG